MARREEPLRHVLCYILRTVYPLNCHSRFLLPPSVRQVDPQLSSICHIPEDADRIMAEAVAAVGLAASIATLVEFSTKIIKRLDELAAAKDNIRKSFRDIKGNFF
jgi:hypothetical protein